jgi:hypothetical protein
MNRARKTAWLAALYAGSLLVAVVVWVILYGRGVVFHFAGVYITPGIFSAAAMILADVLIFLILW